MASLSAPKSIPKNVFPKKCIKNNSKKVSYWSHCDIHGATAIFDGLFCYFHKLVFQSLSQNSAILLPEFIRLHGNSSMKFQLVVFNNFLYDAVSAIVIISVAVGIQKVVSVFRFGHSQSHSFVPKSAHFQESKTDTLGARTKILRPLL